MKKDKKNLATLGIAILAVLIVAGVAQAGFLGPAATGHQKVQKITVAFSSIPDASWSSPVSGQQFTFDVHIASNTYTTTQQVVLDLSADMPCDAFAYFEVARDPVNGPWFNIITPGSNANPCAFDIRGGMGANTVPAGGTTTWYFRFAYAATAVLPDQVNFVAQPESA